MDGAGNQIASWLQNADGDVSALATPAQMVCWSRMQAEAGHSLQEIVTRKEFERRAGGGVFFWGVGNAPPRAIAALTKLAVPVPALFSVMKSKPRLADSEPTGVLMWQQYIDTNGVSRPLPAAAVVTSRADTARQPKVVHYALICRSDVPLELADEGPFDPAAYRNVSEGAGPVGASQVTALLRRVRDEAETAGYRINLRALLTESYWVRLADPAPLTADECNALLNATTCCPDEWVRAATAIKEAAAARKPPAEKQSLL